MPLVHTYIYIYARYRINYNHNFYGSQWNCEFFFWMVNVKNFLELGKTSEIWVTGWIRIEMKSIKSSNSLPIFYSVQNKMHVVVVSMFYCSTQHNFLDKHILFLKSTLHLIFQSNLHVFHKHLPTPL